MWVESAESDQGRPLPEQKIWHSVRAAPGQNKTESVKRPLNKWFQRFGGTKFLKEILIKKLKYIKFKKVNVFLDKS